ncbi:MAG: shikimate dehydrogenase [Roseburia sp.]|nr:shikimate dehydrogenase [Roseburia sp.]MCM1098512.1 shikimate dehydrogenase [Ruminococcus flavefaciens]
MIIDGYTRTCAVFGNPVEHTMSPAIHNTLAEAMGEKLVYVPCRVPEGRLKEAVEGAWALNLLGCNVTVPYKSDVIPFLRELDPLAERIGAVNTLVRTEDGFKGYNTDMPGLYRAMCEDGVNPEGERVLILGAGGVARAVAMLLAEKGAESIVILNRTLEKGVRIAEEINALTGGRLAEAYVLEDCGRLPEGRSFLCIQATNVGMFPKTGEAVIEDPAFYDRIHTGYDLIFNPSETRFMELTKAAGGKAFGGLRMLLWQGIIAYELWTGRTVPPELAERAYEAMKTAMGLTE